MLVGRHRSTGIARPRFWDRARYYGLERELAQLDDRRLEGYRKMLSRLTKDYDVITTAEFLDLHARGKISTPQSVDLSLAQYTPPPKKNKKAKAKA